MLYSLFQNDPSIEILNEDSTEDQRKLAKKRKHIAVYNKEREELDLKDIEYRINILKKLAGRFLIVTNTDLPESEIVSAYKEQWQIERSFRTISILSLRSSRSRSSLFLL